MDARAWVIGGKRGIGKAITEELLTLNKIDTIPTDELDCNVSSEYELLQSYNRILPHYIVYCAGVNSPSPLHQLTGVNLRETFDVNVFGFVRLMRIVAKADVEVRPRSIVAISSDAATRPMTNSIAYCSSKAALSMAVRCAARELAPGVQVNAISPGVVSDTPMSKSVDAQVQRIKGWTEEEAQEYENARIPMRRRAMTSEIASMASSILVSPAYLTGSIIEVNGGR